MPQLSWPILGYTTGALLALAGLWLIWGGRHVVTDDSPPRAPLPRWRASLSHPSRTAIGLSLLFVAYHAAAYASPIQGRLLMVPKERWWIVIAGPAVVIIASLLIDRMERRTPAP
jgi:hypothetical protein